ncbi:hypothetical protein H6G04_12665 [Calothrix membranacea FACHB-236]|nr:hypothetical protein [Calothrix membranacea FACHB-236]
MRQHRLTFKSCRDAIDRVSPQHQNYRVFPTPKLSRLPNTKITASFPHPNYDEKFLTNRIGGQGEGFRS